MLTVLLFLVFLRPDPARKPLPPADSERIQAAHMANIRSMASNGILLSAGPFNDTPTTISGIFILKAASLSEAQRIAASDPTVLEHRNIVEVHPGRGPAGIADEYFRLHKENPATPEGMAEHPLCLIYGATSPARLIDQLHSEGRLGAAGTIEDGGGLVALVIFKPGSVEDARVSWKQTLPSNQDNSASSTIIGGAPLTCCHGENIESPRMAGSHDRRCWPCGSG